MYIIVLCMIKYVYKYISSRRLYFADCLDDEPRADTVNGDPSRTKSESQ